MILIFYLGQEINYINKLIFSQVFEVKTFLESLGVIWGSMKRKSDTKKRPKLDRTRLKIAL